MSVVFAMLASYFLSRTLVPTMVLYLLAPEARARESREAGHDAAKRRSFFGRVSDGFEAGLRRPASKPSETRPKNDRRFAASWPASRLSRARASGASRYSTMVGTSVRERI